MFHLGWFTFDGVQGWGTPGYDAAAGWGSAGPAQAMVRELERAAFDFVLLEDSSAVPDSYGGSMETYLKYGIGAPKFDPAVTAGYLADATTRIGIIPTLTTSFYPPYLLARLTATLDHYSGGRTGVNIVTSSSEPAALNFGRDPLPDHDVRYDIADEYMDVLRQLWESWDADAMVADVSTGVLADAAKVRRVDFDGRWFASRGPLNVPRPPQGTPVIAQAGASPRGRAFSSRHAEIVLTPVGDPGAMKAFRDDIRARAAAQGRDPDRLKVMSLAFPFVFDTPAEADGFRASLDQVPDHVVVAVLALVSSITGIDLSRYDLDRPLPDDVQTNGSRGTLDWLRSGGATLRRIGLRQARLTPDNPLIGTVDEVADTMDRFMKEVGGDGFLFAGGLSPHAVRPVVDKLVPALQARGLVRTQYAHSTLREHLLEF